MRTMTVREAYDLSLTATTAKLRRARRDARCKTAVNLALQAITSARECDVPSALRLLRLALHRRRALPSDRPYIADLLLWHYANRGDVRAARLLLCECPAPSHPMAPIFTASHA